jgi:hypothetical protein
MSRNLFWLSDEQWVRIEPHLPTDVRGVKSPISNLRNPTIDLALIRLTRVLLLKKFAPLLPLVREHRES